MATIFNNSSVSSVGQTEVLLATSGTSARFTVIGLSITNMTESIVLASVRLVRASSSVHYIKSVILPPNQSLRVINGGEKLILAPETSIFVSSNYDQALDVVMSYVEIV